jgi:hypothetical protein
MERQFLVLCSDYLNHNRHALLHDAELGIASNEKLLVDAKPESVWGKSKIVA